MSNSYDEQLLTFSNAETRERTQLYFEKYWLNESDYIERWLPTQDSVFDIKAERLPSMMFCEGFKVLPLVGGDIFSGEDDFLLLQECMRQAMESRFVIIQNKHVVVEVYYGENDYRIHPLTRFEYPVDISWDELMSGDYLTFDMFNNGCKDYFIFGDSGSWGRYVANSWLNPLSKTGSNPLIIMGFRTNLLHTCKTKFGQLYQINNSVTNDVFISEWLPDSYKMSR